VGDDRSRKLSRANLRGAAQGNGAEYRAEGHVHRVQSALVATTVAAVWFQPAHRLGRPGLTPVACRSQEWEAPEPALEARPGAKAFSGRYDGGLYQIEIPEKWNGELMLSAHGYIANGMGARCSLSHAATANPAR
jgi:hypothetical protein